MATGTPLARAAWQMAGMSWTSKVCEPGDSVSTSSVSGRMSAATPAPVERVVILDVHAHPLEHARSEPPRRVIDAVGDQHVPARFRQRSAALSRPR